MTLKEFEEDIIGSEYAKRLDGFDDAIVGVVNSQSGNLRLIYSEDKIIQILIGQGMSVEDAWNEYVECIADLYSEGTEIIIAHMFDEEKSIPKIHLVE